MGTINFRNSRYITLAIENPEMDEETYHDFISGIYDPLEESSNFVDIRLENLGNLRYFKVEKIPGYYEGFQIYIDFNTRYFDDDGEREEALQEAEKIWGVLSECVEEAGLRVVYPGWVIHWFSYEDTSRMLLEALEEVNKDIQCLATWEQIQAAGESVCCATDYFWTDELQTIHTV